MWVMGGSWIRPKIGPLVYMRRGPGALNSSASVDGRKEVSIDIRQSPWTASPVLARPPHSSRGLPSFPLTPDPSNTPASHNITSAGPTMPPAGQVRAL